MMDTSSIDSLRTIFASVIKEGEGKWCVLRYWQAVKWCTWGTVMLRGLVSHRSCFNLWWNKSLSTQMVLSNIGYHQTCWLIINSSTSPIKKDVILGIDSFQTKPYINIDPGRPRTSIQVPSADQEPTGRRDKDLDLWVAYPVDICIGPKTQKRTVYSVPILGLVCIVWIQCISSCLQYWNTCL